MGADHVPGSARRFTIPWEKITERTHVGVLTPEVSQSLELMADGIVDALCRDRCTICCVSEKHAKALRERLDSRFIDHRAATADGRLRWLETSTGKNLAETVSAISSRRPHAEPPLVLVLPVWSSVQRKPAAMRALEATLCDLILTGKARIVCFYPVTCHTKGVLVSAMDSHRLLWFEGEFSHNPFHMPLHTRKSRHRADEMFRQRIEAMRIGRRIGDIHGMDATTSHELNNLLAAIVGNTEILQLTLPATTSIYDQLNTIHESARKAAQICRRIPLAEAAPVPSGTPAEHRHPEPAKQPVAKSLAPTWQGWGTVLLVDDEEAIRIVGKQILERLGFKVLTASDGLEAVHLCKRFSEEIRIIILDLLMPNMTGEEAFIEIRHMTDNLPVVIASGLGSEEIARKFPRDDRLATLPKPYGIIELSQILRKLLGDEEARPESFN